MKRTIRILFLLCSVQVFFAQEMISELYKNTEPQLTTESIPNQSFANIILSTNIPNVDAYLNGVYLGKTPLESRNINPGLYTLRLEKDGYYKRDFYITLNTGTENTVYVELLRISGFLSVEKQPSDAQLFIDGKEEKSNLVELYEGEHLVEVKKFGYETYSNRIDVIRNRTASIRVNLSPAEQNVSGVRISATVFNPKNPANLGRVKFSFNVSTSGTGTVRIANQKNEIIRELKLSPFKTWKQSIIWDGKDGNQTIVDDGKYTITASVTDDKKTKTIEKSLSVLVDSSITYALQDLSFLGGSFGANPSPVLLPKGTVNFSLAASPSFSLNGYNYRGTPIQFSIAYTLRDWVEISGNFSAHADEKSIFAGAGGATVKFASNKNNLYYAGYIRYGYSSEPLLMPYTSSGIGAGAVLGYQIEPVIIAAHGEFVLGDGRGLFDSFETNWNAGLSMHAQFGLFSTAIWGKWLSSEKIFTGISFGVLIPSTSIICTIGTNFTFDTKTNANEMAYNVGLSFFL